MSVRCNTSGTFMWPSQL